MIELILVGVFMDEETGASLAVDFTCEFRLRQAPGMDRVLCNIPMDADALESIEVATDLAADHALALGLPASQSNVGVRLDVQALIPRLEDRSYSLAAYSAVFLQPDLFQ